MTPKNSQTRQFSLPSVFQEVPHITAFLCPHSRAALSVCSRHLRSAVHSITGTLTITDISDLDIVFRGDWPCLSLVLVPNKWRCHKSLPWGQQHQLLMMLHLGTSSKHCSAYIVVAMPTACQDLPGTEAGGRSTFSEGKTYNMPAPDRCNQSVQTAVRYFGTSEWQQAQYLGVDYYLNSESMVQLGTGNWLSVSHLSLCNLQLGATEIAGLAKGSWSDLKRLDLSSNQLDATAVEALLQASWPKLTDLNVNDNLLNDTAVAQLACGQWPALCKLSLGYNVTVSADGAQVLLGKWPLLTSLAVMENRIGPKMLSELSCCHGHLLQELIMSKCVLEPSALSGLVHSPLVALQYLNLGSCRLGADAILTLVMVTMPALISLCLEGNMLDEAAIRHLITGTWPQLSSLTLSRNLLNNAAMKVLAQGSWASLCCLQLAYNDIDIVGIEHLKQRPWPFLRELSLSKSIVGRCIWEALGLVPNDLLAFAQTRKPFGNMVTRVLLASDNVWPVLQYILFVNHDP